ncbi:hypothetical protein [Pacificibacter marinus]|uniref:hypothetical protein n=1 Tax=Pacificibacter marinus TaxID=658057 RepID=UPI001C066F6C|nr:hypothetical protein [Pacificibacter marinus]MBU2866619.1 hypothetical protein [Pacificibacter marinus]
MKLFFANQIVEQLYGAKTSDQQVSRGEEGLLKSPTDQFVVARRGSDLPYPLQQTLEDEICRDLQAKLHDDLRDEEIVRLIVGRAAIVASYSEKGVAQMDGKANCNFCIRVKRLQDNGMVSWNADIDRLFAAVQHVSFSVIFFSSRNPLGQRSNSSRSLNELAIFRFLSPFRVREGVHGQLFAWMLSDIFGIQGRGFVG